MNYKTWNKYNKPEECCVQATADDLLYVCGGFMFLVITKDNVNNVVCFRYRKCKTTFKEAVRQFLYWCKNNHIQYLRIEGNTRRYNFFLKPLFFKNLKKNGLSVIKDEAVTERNVFYVKVY